MAKKGTKSRTGSAANGKRRDDVLPVRIVVEVSDDTPKHYANFAEVIHTKWDFSLIAARLPIKPTMAQIADMQASGILALPGEVTISFPPHLMPGLIRALTIQKEAYEKDTGIELKELKDE